LLVIPAQAGIQLPGAEFLRDRVFATTMHDRYWIPACAGMTMKERLGELSICRMDARQQL